MATGEGIRAFLWSAGEQPRELPILPGSIWAMAFDINDFGDVVGGWSNGVSYGGFLWTESAGLQAIPGLASSFTWECQSPVAINNFKQVVGGSNRRAFLWTEDQGVRDLGLPFESEAHAINNLGNVVGEYGGFSTVNVRPFIWNQEDGFRDLPSPARFTEACAINDGGAERASGGLGADGD